MPALMCLSVFVSGYQFLRRRLWLGGAVAVAGLLSACAPMAVSTDGAIATSGADVAVVSDEAAHLTANVAKMAPPALLSRNVPDPLDALKADLADQAEMPEVDQTGIASWYGPGFHGRKTANGERFNQNEMTAAHRKYAFGTQLCVRSVSTGKTVVVRINDRGPYIKGRVIDLSKAAAEEIGMMDRGVKPVEIYKLDEGEEECPDALVEARS